MAKITLILFLILSLFSCSTEKVIEVDVTPVPAVNEEIAPIPSFEESVPFEDAEEIVVTAEENTEAHPQDDVEPLEEVESESEAVLRPAEEIVDEIGELITGVVAEEDSAEPSVSTVEEDVASIDEAAGKEVTSDIAEESAEPVTPPSDEGTPLSEGSQNALPPALPQESILDNRLSDDIMYLMIELIVVVFIFTITSAIRSRFQRPLPVFISLILTALFIAIPITASMIISGWRNFHYVYFVLAICFIVLRSKDKRG